MTPEEWEQEKEDWAYPQVAPLAIPEELVGVDLGPDAIVQTDGPTIIGHESRYPVSAVLHPDWQPVPFLASNAVEHEFDVLERYMEELKTAHDTQFAAGNKHAIMVQRITLGAVIGQTERLIARYKELYRITTSVVNAEQLRKEGL